MMINLTGYEKLNSIVENEEFKKTAIKSLIFSIIFWIISFMHNLVSFCLFIYVLK